MQQESFNVNTLFTKFTLFNDMQGLIIANLEFCENIKSESEHLIRDPKQYWYAKHELENRSKLKRFEV